MGISLIIRNWNRQDVTKAAMKACRDAISSNSIPAFRRGTDCVHMCLSSPHPLLDFRYILCALSSFRHLTDNQTVYLDLSMQSSFIFLTHLGSIIWLIWAFKWTYLSLSFIEYLAMLINEFLELVLCWKHFLFLKI